MIVKLANVAGERIPYDSALISEPDPNDPVDMWLESFGDLDEEAVSGGRMSVQRAVTGGMGLRRAGEMPKRAAQQDWDEEFKNAQEHAASVLKNLGNA